MTRQRVYPSWVSAPARPAPQSPSSEHSRWAILGAAVVVQLALGAIYAWSLFGSALGPQGASALRLTQSEVALPFELAIGTIVFGAFLGGLAQDRYGPRVVVIAGSLLYATGVITASFAREPDQFPLLVLGYGLIGGLGVGFAYIVPGPMLQKWFPDKPGLATGIAVAGFGLGGVLTTAIAAPLITLDRAHPTSAFLPLGAIYLVMTVGAGRMFRNPPPHTIPTQRFATRGTERKQYTLSEALRTPHWYLLTLILAANVTVSIGFIGTAASAGIAVAALTPIQDAGLVSAVAVANGIGRIIWGGISERAGRMPTFVMIFSLEACSLIALPHAAHAVTFFLLAVTIGLCCGGGFGVMPATTGDVFGLRHVGAIYGLMLVGWSAGGVLGPYLVTALVTTSRSDLNYTVAFTVLGLIALAAIAVPLYTYRVISRSTTPGLTRTSGATRAIEPRNPQPPNPPESPPPHAGTPVGSPPIPEQRRVS